MASASADRTVRFDLSTLAGLGLAGFALVAGLRELSLVRSLLDMPAVSGLGVLLSYPSVLTGLLVPALGLVVLAIALGYAAVFDRRSLVLVGLTVALLYWSNGVAFALTAIVLAGVCYVLDGLSTTEPA